MRRLVGLWLVTAAIVGGCASAKRVGLDSASDPRSVIIATVLFVVAMAALCYTIWRDLHNRGTYMGIVLGTLAEIVIIRRIPAGYHQTLVIVGFVLLAAYVVASWLWPRNVPIVSTTSPILAAADALLARRPPDASGRVEAAPRTGLVAFVATTTILLAIDITVTLL